MPVTTFPSNLPGQIQELWGSSYRTTTLEAISGKEVRVSWRSNPRRRFRVKFDFLRDDTNCPAPNAAYTEVSLLQAFLNDMKGSFNSFSITDPISAASVTVRMVEDSLELRRVVAHVWAASFEVVEVL
ncbi:MAG: DUF2460 domain-containing protein [Deltaproteobacteria bacterium]